MCELQSGLSSRAHSARRAANRRTVGQRPLNCRSRCVLHRLQIAPCRGNAREFAYDAQTKTASMRELDAAVEVAADGAGRLLDIVTTCTARQVDGVTGSTSSILSAVHRVCGSNILSRRGPRRFVFFPIQGVHGEEP